MSLISRYILRETFGAWLVVVAVLFTVLMAKQFADILGDAAAQRLPREAVWTIFGLTSMRYVTLLTPIALFLGIMLALARLNRDCETAALSACGVGPGRLLVPVLTLTSVIAIALAVVLAVPESRCGRAHRRDQAEGSTRCAIGRARARQVHEPRQRRHGDLSPCGRRQRSPRRFLGHKQGERVVTTLAQRAERTVDPTTGDIAFVLHDGRRYEGVPGTNEFLVVEFDEGRIPIHPKEQQAAAESVLSKPTAALLASRLPADRAEAPMAAVGADFRARARGARGAVEPLRAARGALREGRHRPARVHRVRERVVDRAHLGGEGRHPGMDRPLVGARDRAAAFAVLLLIRQSGVFARSDAVPRGSRVTLLRGYIVMAIVLGEKNGLALAVIVAIYGSIDLVDQLHDLGTGSYGFPQLLSFVLLRLPRKVFDTLPAAALIGSLLQPGQPRRASPLVVMRASGVSSLQLLGRWVSPGSGSPC